MAAATAAELGRSAAAEAAALRGRLDALHARCETCLVLLGESSRGRMIVGAPGGVALRWGDGLGAKRRQRGMMMHGQRSGGCG